MHTLDKDVVGKKGTPKQPCDHQGQEKDGLSKHFEHLSQMEGWKEF